MGFYFSCSHFVHPFSHLIALSLSSSSFSRHSLLLPLPHCWAQSCSQPQLEKVLEHLVHLLLVLAGLHHQPDHLVHLVVQEPHSGGHRPSSSSTRSGNHCARVQPTHNRPNLL